MTWFKVDDRIHSHKKAVRAGVPAMGLWVLAGAWCADQLSDGFIPDYMAARIDRDYEENAARLVEAGLWFEAVKDGDKGWAFHQWAEHQPSAESVLDKRAEAKERMARIRAQRKAERSETVRANTSRTESERSSEVRSTPTRPDPTRPDPTVLPTEEHPQKTSSSSDAPPRKAPTRGTRIPGDFALTAEMVAWGRENAPKVNGRYETQKFIDYWGSKSGRDATKTDWVKAWRNWMRKAQEDLDRSRRGPTTGANRHTAQRHDNPFAED
ncbi:hypothetical protein FHX34_103520 [Actinoplanes teichomyceticus]|uniref:DUF1376 domain-containing protein n=2 Tax=Actinoplanes teichomyceticus TaxID=1867 RepID=A0A561WAV9_ACTTI|nr:hypothetical protein FHX34_103520 [Actinoplanes teichomyceticus]GIF14810.1 hypothetical protein Ate01nite_48420 [Actinoplanes teichomyceticus]